MMWITPPKCQGQIVVVSYAATPERALQRVYDQSDRTTKYYAAEWEDVNGEWDGWDPANHEPSADWEPVEAEIVEIEPNHYCSACRYHDVSASAPPCINCYGCPSHPEWKPLG